MDDGQTDTKKLIVPFRNYVNAPEQFKQKPLIRNIGTNRSLGSQFIFTRVKLSYLVE